MKKGAFIETENVTRALRAVRGAEDTEKGRPGMVALHGATGLGKTITAQRSYSHGGGFYLRAFEGLSQHAFYQDLAQEICKVRPTGVARCRRKIVDALEAHLKAKEACTVYFDEADRYSLSLLEDIRDLFDATGCPVVLIGEQHLLNKLGERPRLLDRIPGEYRVAFEKISAQDVMLFADEAAGLALDAASCDMVVAESAGNFRRVYNLMLSIEAAAKAANTLEITAKLVTALLGRSGKKGKGVS